MPVALPCLTHQVGLSEQGMRLDHCLVQLLPDHSRSELTKCIRKGCVVVNGGVVKQGYRLHLDDIVKISLPPEEKTRLVPQSVDFDLLFEDKHLLIISKPPGVVVHPAAGHASGTLVNGLLYHFADLHGLEPNRPGIVHRLDKDTSGIMIVARTAVIQRKLSQAFKDREIDKTYLALLVRRPPESAGRIVAPVGRHPVNRKKMAIRESSGRYAASRWRVIETFANGMCLAEIDIETGRTHQIRVHMASLAAPVAGDALYGGKIDSRGALQVERQMLHSSSLSFVHPVTGEKKQYTAPLWPDMKALFEKLRREYAIAG